ncbi:MAG: isochorismatase family protein [Opitutales bacterium]|jgi:nicotinamidase-related amidase|nr:isochorismatase family protein [Opitutales bacterium]MDP4643806.1 isochorismatase family protein [Opitutales bacterium]MDP4693699.1 isochorismatase family protein [Opitutales bacterium]MDP4777208.1 isochorismatase family protein [Opitutales bacterium]MDP4879332.1 isochorismatase family protein [Opitutales bacterium]
MSNPANHLGLLFIDFQDVFLKAIPDRERLLKRTLFAAEAAELLGCSIAVTEQLPEKLGGTTEQLRKALSEDTPVFSKAAFSAFEADGIDRWIESNQIDHLLIAGIETSICVYQTAVQGLGQDVGITLLSDCISERRAEDREPILKQLLSMDAHVLPSETIFYSLLGSAEHPDFKAFTELVKRYA